MLWPNEKIVDRIEKLQEGCPVTSVKSVAALMAEFVMLMRDEYEAHIESLEAEVDRERSYTSLPPKYTKVEQS